jgi:hypothetical protein
VCSKPELVLLVALAAACSETDREKADAIVAYDMLMWETKP